MTKQQFMNELRRLLHKLPAAELNEMLYDFESHIQAAMENGKTEQEAIANLGSPQSIASELLASVVEPTNSHELSKTRKKSYASRGRGILASVSLVFFNLIFMLGPVIGIAGAFIGLYAAAFACLLSPIALIINLFTHEIPTLLAFFFVLAAFSFGYLFYVLTTYLARYFMKFIRFYLKFNFKIITGGNS